MFFVHHEEGLFLSLYVDDINWLERNKTLIRCGKYLTNKLIWENLHHSFTMFTLGCTQRQCETIEDIVGQLQNHVRIQNFSRSNGEGTELGKTEYFYVVLQLHKVSTPCLDDHQSKEKELKSVRELSNCCSQIVF